MDRFSFPLYTFHNHQSPIQIPVACEHCWSIPDPLSVQRVEISLPIYF